MDSSPTILIGGAAGQGLLTVGQLLSRVLVRSGFHIVVTQDYMSRIRGGHNTFSIRMSSAPIVAPRETVNILIAFDGESVRKHLSHMTNDGIIVMADNVQAETGNHTCLRIPVATLGKPAMFNIMAAAIVATLLDLDDGLVDKTMREELPDSFDEAAAALQAAFSWARNTGVSRPSLRPAGVSAPRMMVNGNEALALGAIAGGLRFAAFYPMTPGTSVMLTLLAHADRMGLVVEQAEDEIAAVTMAIGASFTGAPSLVSTSGGGFALMGEGVSLAGMTETPLVVIIAQRPGPATGLPTRTEQADLEFVLHAGHGEFPRAILAPGSPEQCFELAAHALDLAERTQGPVLILTDQFLADSYRDVAPFRAETITPVYPLELTPHDEGVYARYALTDTGISPRALPGSGKKLVVADSDEHTEDGHITEDLTIRTKMVEKRLRKMELLRNECIRPAFIGADNPDLLFVCWGSVLGAVTEAAEELSAQGIKAASLHFSQVWPLVAESFLPLLERSGAVVVVEGNATGQFARLLRRECGFMAQVRINRYDGLPITPEFILRQLAEKELIS
ncbi:MAG: 2-oxoacid:acceptor oxidoreductase subunit alpha [Geobacteraceae bacterium]|nr:2-oxoacid:acceptor oxidoreductase subunit alpha [Geobacteraceae bacterium]